jgi:hypothetical protein
MVNLPAMAKVKAARDQERKAARVIGGSSGVCAEAMAMTMADACGFEVAS